MSGGKEKYVQMQRDHYKEQSQNWSPVNRDHVVGSFDAHNNWSDYEYLFIDIPNQNQKVCLDFGCGPGRNLVKYANRFARIDGVDLMSSNLSKAKQWIGHNGLNIENFNLYECNGYNLENIPDCSYDIIMSTICLQHICVWEIRNNYMKEFFRVLRPNGYFTAQMGYGFPSPQSVDYYDNNYDASTTNRGCDTSIASVEYLSKDLENIGFIDFKHHVRPTGPGDSHPHWIYFNARKP